MRSTERLNRVRNKYAEVQRYLRKIEELEALATRVTPVFSLTPKGGGSEKDDAWARLIDYKTMCEQEVKSYLNDCVDLQKELECIRNPNIRLAMNYYYVDRLLQEDIADTMGFTDRNIRYYLQKGREIYEDYYGKESVGI